MKTESAIFGVVTRNHGFNRLCCTTFLAVAARFPLLPCNPVSGSYLQRGGRRIIMVALTGVLATLLTPGALGQFQYQRLKSFGFPERSPGADPEAELIEASDGRLYGTTSQGSTNNAGTVFRMEKDGSGYIVLHNFSRGDGDGVTPRAALVEGSDGALYGTTMIGGASNAGTVFKLNKDGTGHRILHNFSGYPNSDGASPVAALLRARDGLLSGTKSAGGITNADHRFGMGTLFKVNQDGTGHSTGQQVRGGPTMVVFCSGSIKMEAGTLCCTA